VLLGAAKEKLLFKSNMSAQERFEMRGSVETRHVCQFLSHGGECKVLAEETLDNDDARIVFKVCSAVVERACKIVAAGIVALVTRIDVDDCIVVAVDGTLMTQGRNLSNF
jgi:hexokinase